MTPRSATLRQFSLAILSVSPLLSHRGRGHPSPRLLGTVPGVGAAEWLLPSFLAQVPWKPAPGWARERQRARQGVWRRASLCPWIWKAPRRALLPRQHGYLQGGRSPGEWGRGSEWPPTPCVQPDVLTSTQACGRAMLESAPTNRIGCNYPMWPRPARHWRVW